MDQLERLKGILQRVSYKPGYTFRVTESRAFSVYNPYDHSIYLTAQCKAEDTITGKDIMLSMVRTLHWYDLETMKDEDIVFHFVKQVVYDLEIHEANEWFKYNGVHVVDPHPEQKKEAVA